MSKKNMDALLSNIMGEAIERPTDITIAEVQAIARKEGFTIRALMEYMMRQGIDSYESKHGKIKKIKAKGVSDVM